MNEVSGRVISVESGVGIPSLLVVAIGVERESRLEDSGIDRSEEARENLSVENQVRLGSVLTDGFGDFTIAYDDDAFRGGLLDQSRPNLYVAVMAPEDGNRRNSRRLFVSEIRYSAGRSEHYLIRITSAQLRKAGIAPPTIPPNEVEEPKDVVARLTGAGLRLETIDQGLRELDKSRVARTQEVAQTFRSSMRLALRESLSRVSSALIDPAAVALPGESVILKSNALIQRGLQSVVNSHRAETRASVKRFVALTDDQRAQVAASLDRHREISAVRLHKILGSETAATGTPTFVIREDPLVEFCREITRAEAECAQALGVADTTPSESPNNAGEAGGTSPSGDVGGAGLEQITERDINRFVAEQMNTVTSPEEHVVTGLEPRADHSLIEQYVRDLSFPPSPADTPAFHDFHDLHIAFEHVWQEAIDEGLLDLAEGAYHDIVELGGNVDGHGPSIIVDPVRRLREEALTVLTSRRVVRDHRASTLVRDHRGDVTVRDHRGDTIVRDHQNATIRVPSRPGVGPVDLVSVPPHPADRLPEILAELERRLREDYTFTFYAANRKERSINFGVVVTYRQRWEPLAYQAGPLAKTITLAPKQTQAYSKKTVVRRRRADKEVENRLRTRKEEASHTTRAEQEIIRKATSRTNFSLLTKGSLSVPLGEGASVGGESTYSFAREASKSSDDVKKAFHEAVMKAAQDYKEDHTTEVHTEQTQEVETLESGEIANPNDEISVTFLFYELQRRYRVSERIYRITPVVFVAQEMPRPDEIDEDWLLAHDWILRRVLLDDSFVPALDYLYLSVVGEQVSVEEMRQNVEQQRKLVEELRRELSVVRERLLTYRNLLERSFLAKAGKQGGGGGGLFSGIPLVGEGEEIIRDVRESVADAASAVGDFLFGGSDSSGQTRQDAIKSAIQQTADDERDLLFRLEREVTSLNAFTETYAKALAEYMSHRTQVARLRSHIKQNILYYMQAIWSYEPPDQRFFRLHKVPVPDLEAKTKTYKFPNFRPATASLASAAHRRLGLMNRPVANLFEATVKVEVDTQFAVKSLAEIADLDGLLGFKGNYMLFPLRRSNALTDFMMDPYVVAGFDELVDPDDLGNWTLEEFADYVCCLKEKLAPQQFRKIRAQLKAQYEGLVTDRRPRSEVITVPTDSLFIEALPAHHSLIEQFKARHRVLDVKRAQAEVRKDELENVRLAARLLAGEREDPDIEKKISIEGGVGGIVATDGD